MCLCKCNGEEGFIKRSGIFGRAVFNLYSLALLLSRYRCRYREIGDRSIEEEEEAGREEVL